MIRFAIISLPYEEYIIEHLTQYRTLKKIMNMNSKAIQITAVFTMAIALILSSCHTGIKHHARAAKEEAAEAGKGEAAEEAVQGLRISLAQWSLHRTFFGGPIVDWGEFDRMLTEAPDSVLKGTDPMEFPAMAASYGIHCIELVNTFYFSKAGDMDYWAAFKKKCDDAGVSVGLIMCDALGDLGDPDGDARKEAAERHYPWVDIAAYLGAASVRVNAGGEGDPEEVAARAANGLRMLAAYAAEKGINILVENHGGYSSDGQWLAGVMEQVDMENVGTLPDFGNFCIEQGPEGCVREYDKYKGIAELMPFAKGVSAKSRVFDDQGNETESDFLRIMKIVKESGFKGYVGIEYEGPVLSEDEGIRATKALLEKVFREI
jgi:sugar phosphate isomerase/epimerase